MIISGKSFYLEINWRKIAQSFAYKILAALSRLLDLIRYLPIRLGRIAEHLAKSFKVIYVDRTRPLSVGRLLLSILNWWLEFLLLILDCLGISELLETISDFVKFNTRPLQAWEKDLARQVFGNKIRYSRVRIDEYAFAGPKQKSICYVSFFLVNSWGSMENSLLLHELTHVWQYQRMGIVYIPRALGAQLYGEGYNYGGADHLRDLRTRQVTIDHFNLEQQADIVSDYYRIKNGYAPRWGDGGLADLPVYEYFIRQFTA